MMHHRSMRLLQYLARFLKSPANRTIVHVAEPQLVLPELPVAAVEPQQKQPVPDAERYNPRRDLERRAYRQGRRIAEDSGLRDADPATERALASEAAAMGTAAYRPQCPAQDQRRVERLAELAKIRTRQDLECDRAALLIAVEKAKLAAIGPAAAYPAISKKLYYGSICGLAISIAPTLHDLFVGLDPVLMWVAGGLCSIGISLFIVHGIVNEQAEERK